MTDRPTYEELETRVRELEQAESNARHDLKALQDKEEKFRAAFEGSHDAITLTTKEGTVLDCNHRALELFGLQSKNDFSEKRPADFSPPLQHNGRPSVEISREAINKVFREGKAHQFEWLHQRKTGEVFPAEIILTPVKIGNQEVLQASIRDISERKWAEEALRESEEKHRALVDGLPDTVMRFDRDGGHLFVSDNVRKEVDIEPGWFIGKTHSELGFPETQCRFWEESIRRVFDSGVPFETEFTFEGKAGVTIFNWRLVPEFDPQGAVQSVLSISRDITDRKIAEQNLERVRFSVENLTDSVFWVEEDGCFIDFNNAACERLGYSREELMKMCVSDIDPDLPQERWPAHWEEMKKCKSMTIETVHRTVTGEFIPMELTIHNQQFGERRYNCVLGRDITERKRAEEALRREEEKFRTLLENIVDWVWMVDASGHYTYVSPQAEELLGYDVDEILGKNPFDFMSSDEVQRVAPIFFEAVEKRERIIGLEDTLLAKDESEVIFETNATPLFGQEDDLVGFMGTCRDISERKKAEEEREKLHSQLSQAHKMEAIGTLAGGIAHDFNNILSIIVGNTDLAMLDVPEWSPAQDNLKEVREATLRARELVKQILIFARQKEHTVSNIRLEPIAKESLKMLRASIPTTVEIRENIEEGLPPVLADPSQIQQIIMNLCTNAGQVMEAEGGTLTFTLDSADLEAPLHTVVEELLPGRYVRMQVKDTGPGIPLENLGKIFDPFFTTKGVGEGTGLGLAVVHGIVQDQKGGIIVESEEGLGTTFSIYLPASEVQSVEVTAEEKMDLPRGTERVLFVDDEAMILNLGQRMLERLGYKVDTRASGTDALECFRQDPNRFDLVVTDMTMPGMRGDRLAEEILEIRPDIPVILCTGYSRQISKEKAREIGIRAFVMKPLTQHELANTVRRVLDQQ